MIVCIGVIGVLDIVLYRRMGTVRFGIIFRCFDMYDDLANAAADEDQVGADFVSP